MHINLAYGTEQVPIDVPDNWINGRCYRPHPMTPCADGRGELMAAFAEDDAPALENICVGKKTCAIAVDSESPHVVQELLPALIELIEDACDLTAADFTIVLTNRYWNPIQAAAIEQIVDANTRAHYRIVLHDPHDTANLDDLGLSSKGIPITVNRAYSSAEFKVILGGVRPDLILGFTGGRALIMPGLSGEVTLRAMYDFPHVADRNSRSGNFRDNPFHMTGVEATNLAGCDLAVSATTDGLGRITGVHVGHFGKSHLAAMNKLLEAMRIKVKEPMDIVVTSGGGSPLDSTLSGIVAALSSAESVLKPDGTIVIAAALDGGFEGLIRKNQSIKESLESLSRGDGFRPGQWIIQRLHRILQDHEVILFNRTVDEDDIWAAGLTPSRDMNEAILGAMQSHGQRCKIVALPDGPMALAEISQ